MHVVGKVLVLKMEKEMATHSFFFKFLFIHLVFAVLDLHYCAWTFLQLRCTSLSLRWLLLVQSTGSRAHRLQ